jgi:NADH:ubiquinone reductase (H+-translocating)
MKTARPRIVIVGCGFGGLFAARQLKRTAVDITVIDRTNHHLFQPLLYQVATAGLSAPAIAAPIRHILAHQRNVTVLMGEVVAIDLNSRSVSLEDGQRIDYDHLIVAAGATHSYFGHPDWQAHAPGLKTLEDAFDLRSRILTAFEHAERSDDPQERADWLSFVVIGAGATGVEMAGTLAEIARLTLRGEFRRIVPQRARVVLLEGGERVLPAFPPDLSQRALVQLERLGVTVRLGCRVGSIDARGVVIEAQGVAPSDQVEAERIDARTVIWAAGVAASPLGRTLGVPLDRSGRVIVADDLSVPGHPEVFVVGDLAAAKSNGEPVPGVSPAAKQMGRHAALNICRQLNHAPTQPFVYRDYGTLATIGRKAAVAHFGRLHLWGFPAWLTWLLAHVYFLIGFRNRVVVMLDWAWAYWRFERSARIVIEPVRPP